MAVCPARSRYLAWLPRCETKVNPCASSTRMISKEPSRLGMNELRTDFRFGDESEVLRRCVFEVQFHCFSQRADCFRACLPKAGDIHIQALRNVEFILAINAVSDGLHALTLNRAP